MRLKDQIAQDLLTVLFSGDEFAEAHSINGKTVSVVMDSERLMQHPRAEYDGLSAGEVLFFVRKTDLEGRPEVGSPLVFDGRQMYVQDLKEDAGVYEVTLGQNRG